MSGAEQSLLSFLEKIDREKIKPIVLLPEDGPFSKKLKDIGIEVLIFPFLIKFGEPHSIFKIPKILRAIYGITKIIKRKRIDIVHSNSPRAGFLGGLSAKLSSVFSIIHVRDIYLTPFSHPLKAFLLDIFSDIIVSVSEATRVSISEKRRAIDVKVKVIYNGIDIKKVDALKFRNVREEMGLRKEEILIGSIGILHSVKGHDILLRAIPYIKNKFSFVKALIVGDCLREEEKGYKDELKKIVKILGIEENVIFTGFREDIFDILNSIDILVLASKYPDPFPRILLEASAMRKPIVASRVGGIPEIIKNGISGILFEPSDHFALSDIIISLLENRERAEQLARNARKMVEDNFSIEKHVSEMTNLYFELFHKIQ